MFELLDSNDRAELYRIDSETTGGPIVVIIYDEGYGEEIAYPADWQGFIPRNLEECALINWIPEAALADQDNAGMFAFPGTCLPIGDDDEEDE